ncbi:SCO family protein [Halovivax asiaticus]|nr:SCO family protein [Halovivax asiaticus]
MNVNRPTVDRRTMLRLAGATALSLPLAGCIERIGDESGAARDDLVLAAPASHDRARETDVPHPIYGDDLPEATVQAPLHDRSVTTTEFVGDRATMLTFVFTSCTTVCPGLTSTLRRIQADSIDRGYADEIAFQTVTFDPEYDTTDVLREYGEKQGVDFDVGNWYFLRPETPARAKSVVEDTFGVAFERADGSDPTESEHETTGDDHDGMNGSDGETGDTDHDGTDESDGDTDETHDVRGSNHRHFVHTSLVLLVNRDGLVERAYAGGPPAPRTVLDDARTVVEEG